MNLPDSEHWIIASRERGPSSRPTPHDSFESANREACRLAILHADDEFIIYRAVRKVSAPRVVMTDYGEKDIGDDDIPF